VPLARPLRDPYVKRAERSVTFTGDQIAAYAEASGDHNPIHSDEDFARSVGLPGVIAHGMLQMGILAAVASEAAGGAGRLRRLYCRFAGMVEPGDTVTFAAEDAGAGKLALTAVNQRGEPVMTKASAEYL
jgi:acyl dehydratase